MKPHSRWCVRADASLSTSQYSVFDFGRSNIGFMHICLFAFSCPYNNQIIQHVVSVDGLSVVFWVGTVGPVVKPFSSSSSDSLTLSDSLSRSISLTLPLRLSTSLSFAAPEPSRGLGQSFGECVRGYEICPDCGNMQRQRNGNYCGNQAPSIVGVILQCCGPRVPSFAPSPPHPPPIQFAFYLRIIFFFL